KYLLRLDTDSFFFQEVKEDIFEVMNREKTPFGYGYIGSDASYCLVGFREWIRNDFLKNKPFQDLEFLNFSFPKQKKEPQNNMVFNTNAVIFDIGAFKSEKYTYYYKEIEKTNGIFSLRWGDHIVIIIILN